jgi:hypothetical protein
MTPAGEPPPWAPTSPYFARISESPLWERASGRAAEGIRTLDLLHGKQAVEEGVGHRVPAKPAMPAFAAQRCVP